MKNLIFVCLVFCSFNVFANTVNCNLETNFDEFIEMPDSISYNIKNNSIEIEMLPSALKMNCELSQLNENLKVATCGDPSDGLYLLLDKSSQITILDVQYLSPLAKYICNDTKDR